MAELESVYSADSFSSIRLLLVLAILAAIAFSPDSLRAQAAGESPAFARRQTLGFFFAYAGDSSHILLGQAEDRRLLHIGVSYNRRLFLNRMLNWQYSGELIPVVLESDPVQTTTTTVNYSNPPMTLTGTFSVATAQACHPASGSDTLPNGDTFTYTSTCSRRWSIGEAMSPVGFEGICCLNAASSHSSSGTAATCTPPSRCP